MRSIMRVLLIFLLTVFYSSTFAGDFYWVGGSGNWNDLSHWATTSGGSTYQTALPSLNDNVYFDANSFSAAGQTVTVNITTVTCRNMDWTGATNTPSFTNSYTLQIGGSLTLISGMNFTAGNITFNSTSAGNTITTGGKNLGNINFDGVGGSWGLQDDITLDNLTLTNGSFASNNYNMTFTTYGELLSSNSNIRSIDLGTSTITLGSVMNTAWDLSNSTNLTFNGSSSTIICTGYRAGCCGNYFNGGGQAYGDLSFTGTGTGNTPGWVISGNNSFNNLSFAANGELTGNNTINNLNFSAGCVYIFTGGTTQTITNTFSGSGTCVNPITIQSSNGTAAILSKSSGAVTTDYATLTGISGTGGATFTANNSTDGGNNSGWTINAAAPTNLDLYWIGGGGNWNDPSHWSTSSGGPVYGCLPSATDNVFFDANSFPSTGQTVIINVPVAYCKNMDWTGASNTPSFTNNYTLKVGGSLTLISGMNITAGNITFNSTSAGNTITSGGKNVGNITFDGVGGSWGLQDDITLDNLTLTNGSFASNNYNMTFTTYGELLSSNSNIRSLDLGTSTITLGSVMNTAWDLSNSTNLTFNGSSSTIICTGYRAGCCGNYFKAGSQAYGNLSFTGTGVGGTPGWVISGNNSFNNLSFAANGDITGNNTITNLNFSAGYVYTLEGGTTQTITNTFSGSGTCVSQITIKSSNGTAATLSKSSGAVTTDYATLTGISGTGGATYTANNSTDGGNNSGWTINAAAPTNLDLFWIGGGGNWNDPSHWSTSSGGPVYGCIPSATDNVFFDANSFPSTGQTVTINVPVAYCKNMDWTGATNTPGFTNNYTLQVGGSLTLISGMNITAGNITFNSTSAGNTITSGGKNVGNITFDGVGGSWGLQDDITLDNLTLTNGSFASNNYNMTFTTYGELSSSNSNIRSLDLGTSTITLGSIMNVAWDLSNSSNLTFNGASTTIICTGYRASCCGNYFHGGSQAYGDLSFTGTGTGTTPGWVISGNNSFKNLSFAANGDLTGNNTINTLNFSAGYAYTLTGGTKQTIDTNFVATGDASNIISIKSSNSTQALISKSQGTICLDYLQIENIGATGGATFNAGTHSTDLGGSSGFIYSPGCVVQILPIIMRNFSANAIGADVLIQWVVSAEINVSRYEIERSKNGWSWEIAGSLPATSSTTYQFRDAKLANGQYYYRLKIVDIDNEVSYSRINSVTISENESMRLSPNPINRGAALNISIPYPTNLSIYNSNGQCVMEIKTNHGITRLDTGKLVPGTYLLKTDREAHVFIVK